MDDAAQGLETGAQSVYYSIGAKSDAAAINCHLHKIQDAPALSVNFLRNAQPISKDPIGQVAQLTEPSRLSVLS